MRHFDYESVAKEVGISQQKLDELRKTVREEFPQDDMIKEVRRRDWDLKSRSAMTISSRLELIT